MAHFLNLDYIYPGIDKSGLEIVSYCLYSTAVVVTENTTRLDFFLMNTEEERKGYPCWTNMYIPGMLPEPCSFLIERIRAFGFSSDMVFGSAQLTIGNKRYFQSPMWLLSSKGHQLNPPLMIERLQYFHVKVEFQYPPKLGNGITGGKVYERAVQIALLGKMVRSIQ